MDWKNKRRDSPATSGPVRPPLNKGEALAHIPNNSSEDEFHHQPRLTLLFPPPGLTVNVEEEEDERRFRLLEKRWDWCFIQRVVAALIIVGACVSIVWWLARTVFLAGNTTLATAE